MDRHRCKVCSRNFGNGRALGGHMRSHVINLSTPKNAPNKQVEDQDQEIDKLHSCSSSSSQGEVENRELSVVLQDCESESTESSKNSSIHGRKRSKRARKQRVFCSRKFSKLGETKEERSSPLSSLASDTTTEEDVAHCLMMMSRDRWDRENENDDGDDDTEDSRSNVARVKIRAGVRGMYRCETCNKLFKSYQALGGHRASYKKVKADVAAAVRHGDGGGPAEEKVHDCPFCHRVFASGQALGGHKRSHFKKVSRIGEKLGIDLNLPAPVDDGDEIN